MSKLDAEFLRYTIFNAAGHTNQARVARAIGTDEATLSLWLSGTRQPRRGSLEKIAGYIFSSERKNKDQAEYNQREADFISAFFYLRRLEENEFVSTDYVPLLAKEFLDYVPRVASPALGHVRKHDEVVFPETHKKNAGDRPVNSSNPYNVPSAPRTTSESRSVLESYQNLVHNGQPNVFEALKATSKLTYF